MNGQSQAWPTLCCYAFQGINITNLITCQAPPKLQAKPIKLFGNFAQKVHDKMLQTSQERREGRAVCLEFAYFVVNALQHLLMRHQLEFAVKAQTKFGEAAVICGNLPAMGQWRPERGLRLKTNIQSFPLWTSPFPLKVNPGTNLEFKLCIINSQGRPVRWESIGPNRALMPKESLLIKFEDSDPSLLCHSRRGKHSESDLNLQGIRKGTQDVINDLASDSSSNREMFKDYAFSREDQQSQLLNQFVDSLTKAVSTQKEEGIIQLQSQPQMQLQHHLRFGPYHTHPTRTHYFIFDKHPQQPKTTSSHLHQQIVLLSVDELDSFKLQNKNQISLFHFIGKLEHICKQLDDLQSWQKTYQQQTQCQIRKLTIVYLQDQETTQIEPLLRYKVDIVVCPTSEEAAALAEEAVGRHMNIVSTGKDEFVILEAERVVLHVFIYHLKISSFSKEIEAHLTRILPSIRQDYHFKFGLNETQQELAKIFYNLRNPSYHCLIVLHVKTVIDISVKLAGDLLTLSSIKHDVMVFILVDEKFTQNIRDKIPAIKNRLLVFSKEGEIYYNGNNTTIFNYLEIQKNKFEESLNIIFNQIGSGLMQKRKISPQKGVLKLPKGAFGNMMKDWIIRCVRDVNRKSLAKVATNIKGPTIQLLPFVLHQNFLLKVSLNTFTHGLKAHQKGVIFVIETQQKSQAKWLEPPQGRDVNLEFCRIRIGNEFKGYGYAPMEQKELLQLFDIIAAETEERKKTLEEEFTDMRNL